MGQTAQTVCWQHVPALSEQAGRTATLKLHGPMARKQHQKAHQKDERVSLVDKVVHIEEGKEDGARAQVIRGEAYGLHPTGALLRPAHQQLMMMCELHCPRLHLRVHLHLQMLL